jgi:hypothetical protein
MKGGREDFGHTVRLVDRNVERLFRKEEDMADEIRADEEEVEAHSLERPVESVEATVEAHDDEDSDDVLAHGFNMGTVESVESVESVE